MKKEELLLQSELVSDCRLLEVGIHPDYPSLCLPCLSLMASSLNGVRLRRGQQIEQKAAGMKAGVPDLTIPVARQGYGGLYLETKTKTGSLSAEQKKYHKGLRAEGYRVETWKEVKPTIALIVEYLLSAPTWLRRES